jgi:hypothetical protein
MVAMSGKSTALVCKPGSYISMVNKGPLDLRAHVECRKHIKAVRDATEFGKSNIFFAASGSKSDEAVLVA